MKIEILFSYKWQPHVLQKYGESNEEYYRYLFRKHKSTEVFHTSMYERLEFILNKCIYLKLICKSK